MNFKDHFDSWQEMMAKSLRKCYENDILGLKPCIESIVGEESRPEREEVIGDDDITNLKIALGSYSVDEFLKNLEGSSI